MTPLLHTPYEGLNYTILDKLTPLLKCIAELPEIQIGYYRGDPGQQRHLGSSYDLFWLNKIVRRLRHWNFHLLSFWLALLLLCDVSYVIMRSSYDYSPLLRNVRHRAVITPVSPLLTRLIRISPSCWTINRSFEIILNNWKHPLDWISNSMFYTNSLLQKHTVRYKLYFKKYIIT